MSSRWHPVSLFDADPDLVAGIAEDDRATARRTLIVPAVALDTGLWSPPDDLPFALLIGLIILAGVLSREIGFAGRRPAGLLGSGAIPPPRGEARPHGRAARIRRHPPSVGRGRPARPGAGDVARPRPGAHRRARRALRTGLRTLAPGRPGPRRAARPARPGARPAPRRRAAAGDHRPPAARLLRARDALGQGHSRRHPPPRPADALDARRARRRAPAVGHDGARDPRGPGAHRAHPGRLAAARR